LKVVVGGREEGRKGPEGEGKKRKTKQKKPCFVIASRGRKEGEQQILFYSNAKQGAQGGSTTNKAPTLSLPS